MARVINNEANIRLAAEAIKQADTLLVTAGAGMGVDSGLPDFRGHQGFWQQHPIYAEQGLTFQDLACPDWFKHDPHKAWGFYGYRYQLYKNTQPHLGFALLKQWQGAKPIAGFVYTSNVDGHFQTAGFPEERIYECHGSLQFLQCSRACHDRIWPVGQLPFEVDEQTMMAIGELPTCPECGDIARPNILMFNDWDWLEQRSQQQQKRFTNWKHSVSGKQVVVIELGAGKKVGGVRYQGDTQFRGGLIRINPREPQGPQKTISLAMGALEAVVSIAEHLADPR